VRRTQTDPPEAKCPGKPRIHETDATEQIDQTGQIDGIDGTDGTDGTDETDKCRHPRDELSQHS